MFIEQQQQQQHVKRNTLLGLCLVGDPPISLHHFVVDTLPFDDVDSKGTWTFAEGYGLILITNYVMVLLLFSNHGRSYQSWVLIKIVHSCQ